MSKVMRAIDAKSFIIGVLSAVIVCMAMGADTTGLLNVSPNVKSAHGKHETAVWGVQRVKIDDLYRGFAEDLAGGFPGLDAVGDTPVGKFFLVRGLEPFAVVGEYIYYKSKSWDLENLDFDIPKKPYPKNLRGL